MPLLHQEQENGATTTLVANSRFVKMQHHHSSFLIMYNRAAEADISKLAKLFERTKHNKLDTATHTHTKSPNNGSNLHELITRGAVAKNAQVYRSKASDTFDWS